ncbi:MAG: alcohol dehydrogenase catalytic domain-containing protein [Acidobacteriia bacterium]|nr:alcohol dehydrogenase catalytic domain-containing protein [Terriglobia bacterium]
MNAIVFDGKVRLRQESVPEASGEALLRVLRSGICNTDLEITRGYHRYQGVLGHEFVARVEEAPDPAWIGKRVVGEINCACHDCDLCLDGRERHCRQRTVLGIVGRPGAMAEFCVLPMENLHEVPDEISDDESVFVEPLAAACEILEQIKIRPIDRIAVLGDGKLAQLIAQVLVGETDTLTLIGKHRNKLDFAAHMGAEVKFAEEVEQDLRRWAGSFDVVVEATGVPSGFQTALTLVRPRGILVMKSTYHENLRFDAAPLVVNEIQVVGSRCGPFDKALARLQRHEVHVLPLVSERYPLSRGEEAFRRAQEGGVLKVLLDHSG